MHAPVLIKTRNKLFRCMRSFRCKSHRGFAPEPRRAGGLARWQIHRVIQYVETNIGRESLQTPRLANVAGLSPFHFIRMFRRSMGQSPQEFVTQRRIERSQTLLLATNMRLAQIAADCGFSDQSHFIRQFRKCVGASPGAWRRNIATMSRYPELSGGR